MMRILRASTSLSNQQKTTAVGQARPELHDVRNKVKGRAQKIERVIFEKQAVWLTDSLRKCRNRKVGFGNWLRIANYPYICRC